jgi:hypothetical protein
MRRPDAVAGPVLRVLLLLVSFGAASGVAAASATAVAAQDVQVALDEAGRVDVLTRSLAERLDLFVAEVPGFAEARLFRTAPDAFVLEISARRDGALVRERRPLTGVEVAELRRVVTQRMEAFGGPGAPLEARALLVGGSSLMGLGFYGWAVPEVLGVEDARARVGVYMLAAAASFLGPWLATAGQGVTYGEAVLALSGATRGPIYGWLLHDAVSPEPAFADPGDPWDSRQPESGGFDRERRRLALQLAGSIGAGVGGFHWARSRGLDAGTAHMTATGSDVGMAATALALLAFKARDEQLVTGTVLAGGLAGTGLGYLHGRDRPYTWGDVEVVRMGGTLGAFSGLTLASWLTDDLDDADRLLAGSMLAGMATGLLIGDRLVRDRDFSAVQGLLVDLGTWTGALGALGATYVLLPEGGRREGETYLTATALGGIAGYALTRRALERSARTGARRGGLDVQLNPVGLLGLRGGSHGSGRGAGGAGLPAARAAGAVPLPLLHASYRF